MKDYGSRRTSERVRRLVNHDFMQLHNEGCSIPEIAEKTSLDPSTVYGYLQTIADRNGTTRDELLQLHRKENEKRKERETARIKANSAEMLKAYDASINYIKELIGQIEESMHDNREDEGENL